MAIDAGTHPHLCPTAMISPPAGTASPIGRGLPLLSRLPINDVYRRSAGSISTARQSDPPPPPPVYLSRMTFSFSPSCWRQSYPICALPFFECNKTKTKKLLSAPLATKHATKHVQYCSALAHAGSVDEPTAAQNRNVETSFFVSLYLSNVSLATKRAPRALRHSTDSLTVLFWSADRCSG